jgi:Raf kinase inhibitor-like YbhB/YbcL family protein
MVGGSLPDPLVHKAGAMTGARTGRPIMTPGIGIASVMLLLFGSMAGGLKMGGTTMAFSMKSASFAHEGDIPKKHTCDGADVSPALSWSDPPAAAQSFSLIMDDPDAPAGTWVHWVIYNIPGQARQLPEDVPKQAELKDGSRQGRNDFAKPGYGGPCPPRGGPHRYFFKLYVLDTKLNLPPSATKADLEKAMKGHVLAQTELMGRYKR